MMDTAEFLSQTNVSTIMNSNSKEDVADLKTHQFLKNLEQTIYVS